MAARAGILTEPELDQLVEELKGIDRCSAWERVRSAGHLVLERLVCGDEAEWRSRKGRRTLSLRRLVQRPGCPFKKSALASAVNVHLFVTHHAWVLELGALGPTHVMQVLLVPEAEATGLLQNAAKYGWSVRELASRARAIRKLAGEKRGRPLTTPACKAATAARRAVNALRAMHGLLESAAGVDESSIWLLHGYLDEMTELLSRAQALTPVSTALRPRPLHAAG